MTSNQIKNEMIRRNIKEGFHSQGECDFNDYQESRVMGLVWDRNIAIRDLQAKKIFTLQFDFLRPTFKGTFDVDFEIDGKGHKTKNDKWEDGLRLTVVSKVIHIGEGMTKPKMWDALDKELDKALASAEKVVPIDSEYI